MTLPSFHEDVINLQIVAFLLEREEPVPSDLVVRMVSLDWLRVVTGDAPCYALTAEGASRLDARM